VSGLPAFAWTALVPFAAGQTIALEIRRFVFTVHGDGRVTALGDDTVGIHMHVPAQLGIDDTVLDLTLSYRGSEAGNRLVLDRTRRGTTKRTAHDDVRMTVLGAGKVRVARPASADGEAEMAFTIGRAGDNLVIGDIAGFGQLDGAALTLRSA
jgi:hypothetical protein